MQLLFDTFRQSLNGFFDALNLAEVQKAFEALLSCNGTIFLSGVGKSGFIAQKIAATLVSTGARAFFLSPAGALHGDIGMVSAKDLFLTLSKSGESEELLGLIPYIRKRGAVTIGIVSHAASRLAKISDLVVQLPIEKEICPYDLAPTVSSAAQLIFGDCLAIALMQAKRFTVSDFASNHPAGFLGRKITLKVSDLMLKNGEIPLCNSQDRLIDILPELTGKRCGSIFIADEQLRLLGIFTDGDLRRAIHAKRESALQCLMGDLMTRSPKTIDPDQLAITALRQMEEDKSRLITILPVLQNEKIVGLLRMHDIIQSGLR
ncbi:MAG TPA: KpsF/GutQ family sugar-phosphate isomerase [Chlamydiales bacterium]|nr:KpsF/GutQ family sugar-phosphate isomerase [Chlamydiales bacterium]